MPTKTKWANKKKNTEGRKRSPKSKKDSRRSLAVHKTNEAKRTKQNEEPKSKQKIEEAKE